MQPELLGYRPGNRGQTMPSVTRRTVNFVVFPITIRTAASVSAGNDSATSLRIPRVVHRYDVMHKSTVYSVAYVAVLSASVCQSGAKKVLRTNTL